MVVVVTGFGSEYGTTLYLKYSVLRDFFDLISKPRISFHKKNLSWLPRRDTFCISILSTVFFLVYFSTHCKCFFLSFVLNQKYTVVHINCLLTQYLLILTFITFSNVYLDLERLK